MPAPLPSLLGRLLFAPEEVQDALDGFARLAGETFRGALLQQCHVQTEVGLPDWARHAQWYDDRTLLQERSAREGDQRPGKLPGPTGPASAAVTGCAPRERRAELHQQVIVRRRRPAQLHYAVAGGLQVTHRDSQVV